MATKRGYTRATGAWRINYLCYILTDMADTRAMNMLGSLIVILIFETTTVVRAIA
jgi:hypothetical protein